MTTIRAGATYRTSLISDSGKGAAIMNEFSDTGNPTLIPSRDNLTSGVGGNGQAVYLIRNGKPRIEAATVGTETFNYNGTAEVKITRLDTGTPDANTVVASISYNGNGWDTGAGTFSVSQPVTYGRMQVRAKAVDTGSRFGS